jgi:hypothetical protein
MKRGTLLVAVSLIEACPFACGSDNPPPLIEQAGQPCTSAGQCYSEIDAAALRGGPAVCLDQVAGGYCTHTCVVDADCCAQPGECKTAYPEVCSPFESTGAKYCFLSCEDSIFAGSGITDANSFCVTYAHAAFNCRSSGGGSLNRKVCVP